jgi:predicted dehydrogenase
VNRSQTRRQFLQQAGRSAAAAGAITGLPLFVSSRAFAKGDRPAPSDRIGVGFIGVGNRAGGNLRGIQQFPFAEVVAVCEVDSSRLAKAKKNVEKRSHRPCATYNDYRKLLESKDVDAVVITTPDHWHALTTIHACQAGKDVYCEKPLTLTIAEGKAMIAAARANKRIVQTGSQQRSEGDFRRACELVRSGKIGKVHTVRAGISKVNFKGPAIADSAPPAELDYNFWLGPAPMRPYNAKHVHYMFRFFWDYAGGQMTNWGAHHLDIAQWGLGMDESGPISAEARDTRFNPDHWFETPEWCEVTYKYADGTTLICGQGQPGGTMFEGDKGKIHVNRKGMVTHPAELATEPIGSNDVRLYESTDHHGNFLDCIKTRKLPICDVAIGHRSATVCHLGNLAIRTGRKLTWDPVKEEIVGDKETSAMLSRPYRDPWALPKIST